MLHFRTVLFGFLFSIVSQITFAQQCELVFDEKSGLFNINSNSKNLVNSKYVFWEDNWRWAGSKNEIKTLGGKNYTFKTSVSNLSLSLSGSAKVSEPNQMSWDYTLQSRRALSDVIGGGIVFRLDYDDNDDVNVELLEDNSGWIMEGHNGCEQITVRFSNPLSRIYFEGRNKRQIRAFFYQNDIKPETTNLTMSVTLPIDGKVLATLPERLGGKPDFKWHKDMIHPSYSPVDLSFLNKDEIPAGKHGFLKADGEKLVFEDGREVRFWGTNIQAYALYRTSPSNITAHAKRLSMLGFNLVRLHHHDSYWVKPNIFGKYAPGNSKFDPSSLKMLDLWINALKEEGIYVWLDLNVARSYTEQDNIDNFDEISKGKTPTLGRGFTYINDGIEARMKEFNEAYLNHVNEYTGLAYKDDPAIINVMITNENDLTHHFANALLPDRKVPNSNEKYTDIANEFADEFNLSKNKIWRSWEFGVSKIFLNDLEHKFNSRMISHLKSLDLKSSVTTTNSWGKMPLSSLPALTDGTMIDVHTYGRPDFFKTNPRVKDNFINWIGAAQVNGMPLSVSEWNVEPFPNTFDRFSSPVYLAAVSALQGWDALMQYGYSQQPLNKLGRPSNYSTFNDPATMAMMPVGALLYRAGHVSAAINTYALSLDKNSFYNQSNTPANSQTIRTLMEQSKLVIDLPITEELPWLKPAKLDEKTIKVTNKNQNFIPDGQDFVRSDTGELTRNWIDGIYTVNSDKSQIAMGWIGGKSIVLDDIIVDFKNVNAAIAVQSLDGYAINNSENILISLASRTEPSPNNSMPFLSEPLNGAITIKAKPGLKLFLLNKYGKEFDLPHTYSNGSYKILIDETIKSYWLILKK